MSEEVTRTSASATKKRKADPPSDDSELAPARKATKTHVEDASQELLADQEAPHSAKRHWRSAADIRKTHKERVYESMKGVCYASLVMISNLNLEDEKTEPDLSLLAVLAGDLAKPIQSLAEILVDGHIEAILEGLKRRAVASVGIGFFSLGSIPDQAALLLDCQDLDAWLNRALSISEDAKDDYGVSELVRDLFFMTVERSTSPDTTHVFPSQEATAVASAEEDFQHCNGISSNAILTGFKSYTGNVKKDSDVTLEDAVAPDGSIINVLRSTDCTGHKVRGNMCFKCRAAQNRWAVRLCRHKKAINRSVDPGS